VPGELTVLLRTRVHRDLVAPLLPLIRFPAMQVGQLTEVSRKR
jgi:hypothetical protein